ncbi:hypothetical protein PoB_000276400 [Plakobranchus ocellatus]|uniref:Uncharacterized protein n=1 Tax=Plakobranchus ocellatus TaxID=259542 RepID=A0AAV3XZY1_9GAST|nr:hypothetical protein PoB_000276400 [Plakobranchus ocellatus]
MSQSALRTSRQNRAGGDRLLAVISLSRFIANFLGDKNSALKYGFCLKSYNSRCRCISGYFPHPFNLLARAAVSFPSPPEMQQPLVGVECPIVGGSDFKDEIEKFDSSRGFLEIRLKSWGQGEKKRENDIETVVENFKSLGNV